MTTIAQQLQQVREALVPVSGELAALEARLLAQHAWGMSHEVLVRDANQPVDENAAQQLQQMVARRAKREPLSQIVGEKDFWKDSFTVTRDVLTPRADSETLIEALLKHCPGDALSILDLGTGSGCLLLSALREFPEATGVAVDRSPAALAIARLNAARLGLESRAVFLEGDWCNPLDKRDGFDIVVSNPPYIAHAALAALDEDVKGFEPHLALDGGNDGLDCYRAIFTSVPAHLNANAHVLVEVGDTQALDVKMIGEAAGLRHLETHRDLAGIERVLVFRN
jgi:release factor glutamine methyltransferase